MQNSAVSFSICVDNKELALIVLLQNSSKFKVYYNDSVKLFTIRHYNQDQRSNCKKKGFVRTKSRNTVQFVVT